MERRALNIEPPHQAPEDDTIFSDPDTFVLHLTTTRVSASRNSGASSDSDSDSTDSRPKPEPVQRVVLGRYEGHPESLDAPQWTRLPADEPVVFRDSAAAVADLLVRATLWKDAMTVRRHIPVVRSGCGCGPLT